MNDSKLFDELEKSGEIIYTTVGDSMFPMLRNRSDIVHIKKTDRLLNKYDLPIYRRDNGQYVLHRILKVKSDHYIICGDNRFNLEKVPHDWVIGVVDEFWRNKKHYKSNSFGYRIYVHIWCDFFFIRSFILKIYRLIKRIIKKVFK